MFFGRVRRREKLNDEIKSMISTKSFMLKRPISDETITSIPGSAVEIEQLETLKKDYDRVDWEFLLSLYKIWLPF